MPRNKIKNETLPVEVQIDIQAQFDKLMQFYDMSGLHMTKDAFYAVIRGDECLPEDVTAVELAYANVLSLDAMSSKELVIAAQANLNQELFDREPEMRRYLQVLVGKILFGGRRVV